MKKVLLINGSPHEKGNTHFALNEASKTLVEQGFQTEIVWIGTKPVRGCISCGGCVRANDGHCVFNDDLCNEVIDKMQLEPLRDRLHYLVEKRFRGELNKCKGCQLCK